MEHIAKRLDSLARFELLKMKRDERPADLMQPGRFNKNTILLAKGEPRVLDNFAPPNWWTYYVEELPKWYDMIVKQLQAGQPISNIKMD